MNKSYPTIEEVKEADRFNICKWYRHLPSASNEADREIMNLVIDRYMEVGGFTPEISKAVGW
jgi:hypothetical protein